MDQDPSKMNKPWRRDPAGNPVDDAPHRDPLLFPLDVQAPQASTPGWSGRQASPPSTPKVRKTRPVYPPAPPNRPPAQPSGGTPTQPKPVTGKKKSGGCLSWAIMLGLLLFFSGYYKPLFNGLVQLVDQIFFTQTPEFRFESFKRDHAVATVQLNPRSDPSGFQFIVIAGLTDRERRNFFIETGVLYRYAGNLKDKGTKRAGERIYLDLDDATYKQMQGRGMERSVQVPVWGSGILLRIKPSAISYYHETEVSYFENNLTAFLQQEPKTAYIPTVQVKKMKKGVTVEAMDAGLINETGQAITADPPAIETRDNREFVVDTASAEVAEPENIPRFAAGRKAWDDYIELEIRKNLRRLEHEGRRGRVRLTFLVDEKGFISEVKAQPCPKISPPDCLGPDTYAATMLVEAVQRSPRWIPARRNGVSVSYQKNEQIEIR